MSVLEHTEVHAAIKETIEQLYPTAGSTGFKSAADVLTKLVKERAEGFDRPLDPVKANLLRTYNRNLHRILLAYKS